MTRLAVLVHGFMFDARMWEPTRDAIADAGWTPVAVDLPGFGSAPAPERATTMADYAAAVEAATDLDSADDVALIGYSMGGQVVMEMLARDPERYGRIVLVDTNSRPDAPEVADGRRALADRLEREGAAEYNDEFLPQLMHLPDAPDDAVRRARTMMARADPHGAAAALRARAIRPDYLPVLEAFDGPALVVVGELDLFDQGVLGRDMAAALPHGRLETMPGVGHTPNMEDPASFNAVLGAFLTG